VPWLVLAATGLFAWSSFGPKPHPASQPPPAWVTVLTQSAIGLYGGFFGGGAGIMTLASLTLARLPVRNAGGTKNVLVALSNLSAAVVFALSGAVAWREAALIGAGAMLGGYLGARALKVLPERLLKFGIVVIGIGLTIGLFLRD
jgi:uncharacterized membrane protein YfcA